jgi:hypothetical protein
MVDVMLTCDAFGLSSEGWAVIVLSSDMDVLPAVAMIAARAPRSVALIRSIRDSAGLYEQELSQLDVPLSDWTTP